MCMSLPWSGSGNPLVPDVETKPKVWNQQPRSKKGLERTYLNSESDTRGSRQKGNLNPGFNVFEIRQDGLQTHKS